MDFVTFETRIRPMVRGRATCTILPLPPDVLAALAGARRVEGEIAEHPVNLAVIRAPAVEDAFLCTGALRLDRSGVSPGDRVEVRLRPAPDDRVDLPTDVEAALRAAGVSGQWEALSPGRRRRLLCRIDSARADPTRAKRIAAPAQELAG